MTTKITGSFVDSTTIQLRLELGEIDQAVVTTEIPTDVNFNEGDGYGFDQSTSELVGRLRGADGQYYMPYDSFTPSDIADLFVWTETDGVRSAPVDDLGGWSVSVDGVSVDVTDISRKANILETATVGWTREFTTVQNVFLELAAPLDVGDSLEVAFEDDDGQIAQSVYENGNLASYVLEDALNAHGWSSKSQNFDGDGDRTAISTTYDDGRIFTSTYSDGQLTEKTIADTSDIFVWRDITTEYDDAQNIDQQTYVYDDGRVLEVGYENGLRSTIEVTDVEDAYVWISYFEEYDTSGQRTSRTVYYDDGSERTVVYSEAFDFG